MINVYNVHANAAAFQTRAQASVDRVRAAVQPGKKQKKVKQPGEPAPKPIHPDPVNLNRARNFSEAARALEAHAMERVEQQRRNGGR